MDFCGLSLKAFLVNSKNDQRKNTMDAWKSTSERNLRRLYSLPIERFSQPFYRQLHEFFTFFARPLTMLASFNVHVSTTRDFSVSKALRCFSCWRNADLAFPVGLSFAVIL